MIQWLAALLLVLQPIISVRTELITVSATVTDARGRPISGLRADSFHIIDEGEVRPVDVFHHGDAPVTLGLIVDRSESMEKKSAALRAATAVLLATSLRDDELFAIDFNARVSFALPQRWPFTRDAKLLRTALAAGDATGRTALYDAIAEGLEHAERGRAGKRVLVVISDGGDNASRYTYERLLARARRSNAVIYAIGVTGTGEDADLLARLCQDTGGAAYFPQSVDAIAEVSADILRTLREQYTLGFTPAAGHDGRAFHKIEVSVAGDPAATVRVRTRVGSTLRD